MKKNVASQKIGCQMVSATDGSAFTGSVTVAVTVDAGTQATGSVGSGACTHEGNGYHTYAPAQAETNGDLVAFTFTGTGAVPATVQVYTSFPQTVDNATGIADIQSRLPAALTGDGNIKADTLRLGGTLQTARDIGASVLLSSGTGTGQLDFTSGVVKSNLVSILGTALTETSGQIAAAFKKFFDKATPTGTINSIPDAVAGATGGLFIAGTNAATTVTTSLTTTFTGSVTGNVNGNVGGNVTGSVGSLATQAKADVNAEVVDALATDTYAEPGQGAPAATATLAAKINYLYKAWRNKKTQTSTTWSLYADDTTTVDQKSTVSDDGTTATRGEIATGP